MKLGITFKSDITDKLVGYTDSNCARLKDGQRSIKGYTFFFSGEPVSYQSKQQFTVPLSSIKAKYMATSKAGKKALWIVRFLAALGYRLLGQLISLRANNRGAIVLTANLEFY